MHQIVLQVILLGLSRLGFSPLGLATAGRLEGIQPVLRLGRYPWFREDPVLSFEAWLHFCQGKEVAK